LQPSKLPLDAVIAAEPRSNGTAVAPVGAQPFDPNAPVRDRMVFRVGEALSSDDQGRARLHPADMKLLGIEPGQPLRLTGRESTLALADVLPSETVPERTVLIDGLARKNAGVGLQEGVRIEKVELATALTVRLARVLAPHEKARAYDGVRLATGLAGLPVQAGMLLRDPQSGSRAPAFRVASTIPGGPARITPKTSLTFVDHEAVRDLGSGFSYEDIGGLEQELARIREIVELPLRFPHLFQRMGIQPPKGVLLYGPPGTGKTLIARVLASESRAHFIHVNGPEVVHKLYGESEAKLREIFDQADHFAPSIVFIDEIDALAPRRSEVQGDVEKRLVAQFLSLLDGFEARGQVIVIGATNLPDAIDPALRRPGRFDREIEIGVPTRDGRLRVLEIHTKKTPLAADVDLGEVADRTHGYVGADLASLCQEAAMAAIRRCLHESPPAGVEEAERLGADLRVGRDDFLAGFRTVNPSAAREIEVERPSLSLKELGGDAWVKELLRPVLVEWGQNRRGRVPFGMRVASGLLLSGPTGCGKSYVTRALAGELGLPLIEVEGRLVFSKWQGESEKALAELFAKARRSSPCVLLFDELDALGSRRRAGDQGSRHQVLSLLLKEIDRLVESSDVLLVAATNRLDLVDPALLRAGRFDYLIEFPPLLPRERLEIFQLHARHLPLAAGLDLERLATEAEGFTPSDIAAACRRAGSLAVLAAIDGGDPSRVTVRPEHFQAALDAIRRLANSRG